MPLDMSNQPELKLPFESTRALLAKWRKRDANRPQLSTRQDGKSITWGQIAAEADRIAQFLNERGVRPATKSPCSRMKY